MAVESADDRATMLSDWDSATIGGETVNGIFDNGFVETGGGSVDVSSRQPQFICRTADISSLDVGDNITINSTTYKVTDIEADETGDFSMLILEDQS